MVMANMPTRLRFNMVGPLSEGLIRPIFRSSCCKVAVQVYWIAAGSSSLPCQAPFAHRNLWNFGAATPGLTLKPAARLTPVEIAVDVELQQYRRMIRRSAGRLGI